MSITYTLKNPITYKLRQAGGEEREQTISEITLRQPIARDLIVMDAHTGLIGRTLVLIAELSGVMQRHIEELSVEDFTALGNIVGDFFPGGLETGGTS